MEHRLIVTADDFGACHYIDNGIREAIKAGVISSVAAMINFEPRDANHPHGEYPGSIQAIKSLINDIQHHPDYAKRRNVRVGLHFNFHAGCPVYPDKSKVKSLLSTKNKIQGKPIFKTIEEFNPSKIEKREVIKELHAQYSKFYSGLGYIPDHFSSHFPIIFMTPDFFDSVCTLAHQLNIPIRNPFLIWQTKNEGKNSPHRNALIQTKKFFKKRSKTKHIDLKRAIKLIDTLNDTILNGWKRKNIRAMKRHQIPFADYVNVHLYGNGHEPTCVDNIFNHLLPFHPECYQRDATTPIVTEMVTHVGKGAYNPAQVPNGIDENYFSGRSNELKNIINNEALKKTKLYNYKYAFR